MYISFLDKEELVIVAIKLKKIKAPNKNLISFCSLFSLSKK